MASKLAMRAAHLVNSLLERKPSKMSRILVVEDEKDVVTLIKFLLEKGGHRVTEAYNGAQALEITGVAPAAERSRSHRRRSP